MPVSAQWLGRFFRGRIASSMVVPLGFRGWGRSVRDWACGVCWGGITVFEGRGGGSMRRVFAWFSTFCMSLSCLCPVLARAIGLRREDGGIMNSSFPRRVCVCERLLEVRMSGISCKLEAAYVFVFVRSAIFGVSML